jgi:hypothetical protein
MFDDIICVHDIVAMESNYIFAGKIIDRNGSTPTWCPILYNPLEKKKPCKHLRNTSQLPPPKGWGHVP